MSLAVESGMALNCCALSVFIDGGARKSCGGATALRRWQETEGAGSVAACVALSSSSRRSSRRLVLSFQRVDLKSERFYNIAVLL